MVEFREWHPSKILDNKVNCLIILNRPIENMETFKKIWKNTKIRICADGGLDRLYSIVPSEDRTDYLPDYVIGDFDSLSKDVSRFYEEQRVRFVNINDQDTTDFEKCLNFYYALSQDKMENSGI
jgi:thiamine pyrophosphokinase